MRIKMPAVRIAQGNYWKFHLNLFTLFNNNKIHSRYSCSSLQRHQNYCLILILNDKNFPPCPYNKSATRQLNTEMNFVSLSFLNFHRNYFMCFDCFYYVPFFLYVQQKKCGENYARTKRKKIKIRKNVLNFFFFSFF